MKKRKMAIEIKEYVGHEFLSVNSTNNPTNLKEGYVETYIDENSLMVEIEAIHSRVTRNNTYYSPECLKESVPYWTNPYERPVIMHHNERDGQIIGRIKSVEYKETGTRSGTSALIFTANVGDEEGKKGIKNGTLSTVSIGVIAHDLRCSICGTNLAEEGMCEHEKGETYDGKLCYWIINKMEPKEVSYVIVPSDIYAHNIRVYDAIKKKKSEVKESVENIFEDLIKSTKEIVDSIQESATETTEGTQVDEEVEKGAKTTEPETKQESEVKDTKKEEETEQASEESQEEKTEEAIEENKSEEESKEEEEKTEESESKEEAKTEEKENEELIAAQAKIEELTKEVEKLKSENEKLSNKAENEKRLKESAEAKLVEYQAKEKKSLVEQINKLRTDLNLTAEDEVTLIESSEETLRNTIKQLNEFTAVQKKIFGMQTLTSPVAVSESKDNTTKENNKVTNVKESIEDSNKSLEDDYIELLKNIF